MADYVIPRDEWAIFYRQSADKQYAIKVLCDVTLERRSTIEEALIADGCALKVKKQRKPSTKLDEKLAMQLHKDGLVDSQIAKQCGVSTKTAWMWRKAQGLPSNYQSPDREVWMEMYLAGASDYAIAEYAGVNRNIVRAWRQHRGLATNHKNGRRGDFGRASAGSD